MGRDLFDRYPRVVEEASAILGYSVRELCLDDPGGKLKLTQYTQPALFTVSYLHWLRRAETQAPPDAMAGHSLGEYVALCCGGAFDFATGLRLVMRRGALMSGVSSGAMIAVIGLSPARIRKVLEDPALAEIDVANFNSYEQTVLAGPASAVTASIGQLEAAGARAVVPLNVSAPFHSRHVRSIEAEFDEFISRQNLRDPSIPVISNYTAAPHCAGEVRQNLIRQISNPVRWVESVECLFRMGCSALEEVGPGNVLTRLVEPIRARSAFAS
jgi:trans-AT polyketide synthase/acyltransferase/oxidoreductase domain-containing protein